jgi:poly-gamma-glutamate capsule biosynthesis protein CapA/YwtB (metallophosphatase superfamily)
MVKQNADEGVLHITAVGDCMVLRKKEESIFTKVMPYLTGSDVGICQLETCISKRGSFRVGVLTPTRANPEVVSEFVESNFNVVSFASNNALDSGYEAFFDTIEALRANNINVIGAGRNVEEARRPAYLDKKGIKVAVLAFCSILQYGYDAGRDRPGVNPIKISTFYEPTENLREQPGTPAKIVTIPDKKDAEAMERAIGEARAAANIVIVLFHWGVHFHHSPLAMYQLELGHRAIDCGADLIIGSHPHVLQAIEVYKGKGIFYSLGNFAFDRSDFPPEVFRGIDTYLRAHGMKREDYFARSKKTAILKAKAEKGGIRDLIILPAESNHKWQPEVRRFGTVEGKAITDLLLELSSEFGTAFSYDESGLHVKL